MNHDARLRNAGLPTMRTLRHRILRTYDAATPAQRAAGQDWYAWGQDFAATLGDTSGVGGERAAAVISHLSPRTSWARNVEGARALLLHNRRLVGIITANYDRARGSLEADDVVTTFGGPKTQRFYRNLSGQLDVVTVDVWAARIAGVTETQLRRVGVYDAVEAAYQRAASARDIEPAALQATTWIAVRGRAA